MARTFTIRTKSNSDSVDMISEADPGIMAVRGGLGPTRATNDLAIEGKKLRGILSPPIVETLRFNVHGSSQDNVASQIQTFFKLMDLAHRYHDPEDLGQDDPVIIEAQTTNEAGARYAMVYGMASFLAPDLYRVPFEAENHLEEMEVNVVRSRRWSDTLPDSYPTSIALGNRAMNDAIYADLDDGGDGDYDLIKRSTAAAISGDYGLDVTVNGTDDSFLRFEFPDDETTFSVEFDFDPNTVDMENNSAFRIISGIESDDNLVFYVHLRYTTEYRFDLYVYDDSNIVDTQSSVTISDVPQTVRIEFVRSTGPGNDDGTIDLYIDDEIKFAFTGIDNDTKALDELIIGVTDYASTVNGGTIYFDDIKYADSVDEDWHFTIDFEDAKYVPVTNHYQKMQITHIFNYDDSEAAFSENLVGQHDAELFVVDGSTPAVDDIVYIGSDEGPFFVPYIELQTALNADVDIEQEYNASGDVWTDIDGNFDERLTQGVALGGFNNEDGDWVTRSINGVTAHWMRLNIASFTSWTTTPKLNRAIYDASGNYVEIHQDRLAGDADPISMIRFFMHTNDIVGWVAMGLKSRGLDEFNSMINAGGDNPDGWTITDGTDTSLASEDQSPSGQVMQCDFTGDASMQVRVTFGYVSGSATGYRGVYRIFLRARQVGGSAGDVIVRGDYVNIGTYNDAYYQGEEKTMQLADQEVELIDLGRYEIHPTRPVGDEKDEDIPFDIVIKAQSTNGSTPNLDIYDIVLLPIDEWSAVVRPREVGTYTQTINRYHGVQIDGGVLREGTIKVYSPNEWAEDSVAQPLSFWRMEGPLPRLPANTNARLFFLFQYYDANNDLYESGAGLGGLVEIFPVEQWELLRGAA